MSSAAIITPFAFSHLGNLSDAERDLVERLGNRLLMHNTANCEALGYYEGTQPVHQLGISTPPSMRNLDVVAGWGGTAVDVLEERLDWLGWTDDGDLGLDDIYDANSLDVESGMAQLDALIFGCSFVAVGAGADGEPSPLITPLSPQNTTGIWDARSRRLSAAVSVQAVEDHDWQIDSASLYFPDETVRVEHRNGVYLVVDRDQHNLGRVPVVKMPNRIRASREAGRSEITRAVRYYTDAAVRTLLGLEVNREFYNAPQRVALGVDEDAFKTAGGSALNPWQAIMGRIWALPRDENGDIPQVQQMSPSSPAPYLDQVRGYATLLAAEAGIPPQYLGFQTDNPASADAIRAGEARLVKRAERRQVTFGRSWLEVGRLALLIRDGVVPDEFSQVSTRWRDAATPTRAASADEALKLTSSGILPAESQVVMDRIGLTPAEQRTVRRERQRLNARSTATALAALTDGAMPREEDPAKIKAKADAMGVLIRSGVSPESAAERVGLSGVDFTGAVPVSLRLPEREAEDLEQS